MPTNARGRQIHTYLASTNIYYVSGYYVYIIYTWKMCIYASELSIRYRHIIQFHQHFGEQRFCSSKSTST